MPARGPRPQYGWQHQKRRAALLPHAVGTPCPGPALGPRSPRCTGLMTDPRLMDLDHTTPAALGGTAGDRIVCRYCNRSSGARLGNQLRGHGTPRRPERRSEDW